MRIFSAPGADQFFPSELTIEDVHLGSPSDDYFQRLFRTIGPHVPRSGKNRVRFTDCVVDGIKFDAVVYRIFESPTKKEARAIEKQFSARVKEVEEQGLSV